MPFDGSGFQRKPVQPEPPKRHGAQENILTGLAVGFVILMFVLPISAGALVDVVHAIFGT